MKKNRKGTLILRSRLSLLKPVLSGMSLSATRVWQDRVGRLMAVGQRDAVTFEDFTIGNIPACTVKPRDEVSPRHHPLSARRRLHLR